MPLTRRAAKGGAPAAADSPTKNSAIKAPKRRHRDRRLLGSRYGCSRTAARSHGAVLIAAKLGDKTGRMPRGVELLEVKGGRYVKPPIAAGERAIRGRALGPQL